MTREIRSTSAEDRSSTRQQQNSRAHREYFKRGRLERHDADSRAAPLPQILDEEERVEDVHTVRRLIEYEDGALREKLAGDVESLLLRVGETRDASGTDGC